MWEKAKANRPRLQRKSSINVHPDANATASFRYRSFSEIAIVAGNDAGGTNRLSASSTRLSFREQASNTS